jgi:predicted phosphodiesterase
MAKPHSKTMLAFGDVHVPKHNPRAVGVFCRVADRLRPDLIVCLGDLLDCGQFSVHPPTYGVPETEYVDDLRVANDLLDRLQKACGRLIMVEGNHEYRLDRWAAAATEGRGAYSMLAPRIQLTRGRTHCTYVPYGSADGRYPHYPINSRIIAVHGWSYARHATKQHLQISQGKSVIHGHTHRADACIIQNIWSPGNIIQARSAGCLCHPIPLYGTGRPVEWVNAFIIGYLGRRSDTLYTIPIMDGRCILPDGTEVAA